MKTLYKNSFLFILALLFSITVSAQFKKATLQASGLTCAMCSRAINNALEKLSYVQSVQPDIKNSSFHVVFKPNTKVNIDELKNAVEDAGFSVANLKLTGNFDNLAIKNDEHVEMNGNTFHFLNVKNQTLNGEREIVIVDKHFLPAKAFKKFSAATQMKCIQTGKAEACCAKQVIAKQSRIYHATI